MVQKEMGILEERVCVNAALRKNSINDNNTHTNSAENLRESSKNDGLSC